MKPKTKDYLIVVVWLIIVGFIYSRSVIKISDMMTERVEETTTAKPIYQQQIGDDTEPDILIIYEAEVDGVKVYPSVIKESE